MPPKPETKKAVVTATLYRLPIADSAYGKVDCLGGQDARTFTCKVILTLAENSPQFV